MKELQELMASVREEAEKTRDLMQEKASNEAKVKEIVIRNVKTVCDDFLKEVDDFLELIRKLSLHEIEPSTEGLKVKVDINCGNFIEVIPYASCLIFNYLWNGYGRVNCTGIHSDTLEDKVPARCITPLLDYFGTEEKAQKTMQDYVYPVVEGLLDRWQKALVTKNAILAVQIEKLKEKLDNTSVITESEDGRVEIHLGGKTYTAVLKEGE